MKRLTKRFKCTAYVYLLPFIVCAAIAFLPWWIYGPITLLGTMMWLGAFIILSEKKVIVEIKEDPETKESFIEIPESICKQLNFNEGDTIIWKDNKDGSYTLSKKNES